MIKMKEIICKCGCGRKKMVRSADIARGWGKYFSKSCKAKAQESRTRQYSRYLQSAYESNGEHLFSNAHLFSNEE